jgi:hypothetical protein
MTRTPSPKPKGPGRKTSGKSGLLEHCVGPLKYIGFHTYTNPEFKKIAFYPERYVVQQFPHESLYGTRGTKEAYIVAADPTATFISGDDGKAHIIMEAKWQEAPGSVDEKLPYIYECFLVSPYPNWIVVFDGRYWRTPRGKAAVMWLEAKASAAPADRRLYVRSRDGFINLANQVWGTT